MTRRLGKFYASHELVTGGDFDKLLCDMRFVPYRVELLAYNDCFEFVGTSEKFDALEEGQEVPVYRVSAIISTDGRITSKVEK